MDITWLRRGPASNGGRGNKSPQKMQLHFLGAPSCIFLPVTRRVKGYTKVVEKYVTDRRKSFRPC